MYSIHIGDGSFGTVFQVKRISDGQEYALKKVSCYYFDTFDNYWSNQIGLLLNAFSDPYISFVRIL